MGLSEQDREALRKAVRSCRVEDGAPVALIHEGDVDHVTYMVGAAAEAIVARHVAAALTEAADDVLTEFDPPIEACIWASEWLRDRAARMSSP